MKVTVHFGDGEELEGDADEIDLHKLGFPVRVSGGNNRTVWVALPAIKYVVVEGAEAAGGGSGDPRANEGLPKVVFHFTDGETLHSYRDGAFTEAEQGFTALVWDGKKSILQRAIISGHGLKGVFHVDSWDSRGEDEKRRDSTRRRKTGATEVPTAWMDESEAATDPEIRRVAYSYQRRLALERDLELSSSDPIAFEAAIRARLDRLLEDDLVALKPEQKNQLVTHILRESVGYGPIDPLLKDPTIAEIMVNAPDEIYIERNGQIMRSQVHFDDNSQLMNVIRRMAQTIGRRIDESTPMVDARLPDGSRLNAIIPPAATRGPALTIRKFRSFTLGLDDLITEGTLSPAMATFLQAAVQGRLNILISGGTGSGKTTTMNVLGALVPIRQRVVTIEDSAELQLSHPHVVSLEYRPPNVEGKGELTIRSLLRNSMRMRPDRVMVGEVRDAAALDMLQAMNTGHDGSMSTIHANSARDAFSRLETMVMTGSADIPLQAVRSQIASALNIVLQQARLPDGSRKIIQIAEVAGYKGDAPVLKDIFRYRRGAEGTVTYEPTGAIPESIITKMNFYGIDVPREVFSSDPYEVVPKPEGEEAPEAVEIAPALEAPPEVAEAAQLADVAEAPPPVAREQPSPEPEEPPPAEAPAAEAAEPEPATPGPVVDAPPQVLPAVPAARAAPASISVGALQRRIRERRTADPEDERSEAFRAQIAERLDSLAPRDEEESSG